MSSRGRYSYGHYPPGPSSTSHGGTGAGPGGVTASYPAINPAGVYPPTAPYIRHRPGAQPTPWPSHRPYPTPPPQVPPARAPENMSSLTRYTLKVKEDFIFPSPVPSASIERVNATTHVLATTLEDAILSEAGARFRAANTSSPSGSAADSLLGDLSSVAISSSHPAGNGEGCNTGGSMLAARAPPPVLPVVVAAQPALEFYRDMDIGTALSRQLALAKYPGDEKETVEAFCSHFETCKEILHDNVTDLDIAAALYATDTEIDSWQQSAMDLLISGT